MSQDLENVTSKEVRDPPPPAYSRPKPLTHVCLARFPAEAGPVPSGVGTHPCILPCSGTRAVEDPGLELDFSPTPEIMSRLSALSEP